jgi:hypothetical protein
MKTLVLLRTTAAVAILLATSSATAGVPALDALRPEEISGVRIRLDAWGSRPGFEMEVPGDDPRVERLVAVIRESGPGDGHKCPNTGSIRFAMTDGREFGAGLLPGHTGGTLEIRWYDGDRLVDVYRVNRTALIDALAKLGVPADDPAFGD